MAKNSNRGAVLFVTEHTPSPHVRALARSLGAELARIDDLPGDRHASLIFSVDLRNVNTVLLLKDKLKQRGTECRIFLVDPDIRVSTVHANVLGADSILPLSATAADIRNALDAHFGDKPLSRAEAISHSVDAGVQALGLSFTAIADNLPLDNASVLQASSHIAETIGEVGVQDWLATVKGHHKGTFQHCMLVTGVVTAFGTKSGMARRDVVMLTVTGLLHDIGKAMVPIELLDKPGALTPAEAEIMRRHPVDGYDYLSAHSKITANVVRSVRGHHEYLDGSGYPDGLTGGQIDDLTRIVTVCDIYAALVEQRSYKPAKSPAEAIEILTAMAVKGKVEASLVRELGRIMIAP